MVTGAGRSPVFSCRKRDRKPERDESHVFLIRTIFHIFILKAPDLSCVNSIKHITVFFRDFIDGRRIAGFQGNESLETRLLETGAIFHETS